MKGKNRLNIGFFTCHLDNAYAFEICKGVEFAAREADVNLVIFPGMFLNASYNDPINAKYDYQYNSIFYYASKKSLDALIISIGSIGSFLSVEDMHAFLDHFDLPVLTVEIEVDGYPSLYTDGKPGMRQVVEHIIKDHGKRKIGFVSGRKENDDANERLKVYRDVLEENGIPYDENLVAYGDFSEYTEDLVDDLLNRNPDMEAILFANDTMAIGGYKAIRKHGLVIGKDILVTGFDNAPFAVAQSPTLTTVDNKIMDIGYNAVYQAVELIRTGKTSTSRLPSSIICRNSCGCDPASDPKVIDRINQILPEMEPQDLLNEFKRLFLGHYENSFYSGRLFKLLDPFFLHLIRPIFLNTTISRDQLLQEFHNIFDDEVIGFYFTHMKLTNVIRMLSEFLTHLNFSAIKRVKVNEMFNVVQAELSLCISRENFEEVKRQKESVWSSIYITRDTLVSSGNEKKAFSLIMQRLYENSGFRSSYIYLYDKPAQQLADGTWMIPDYLLFQAANLDGRITVFEGDDRILPSSMIFHNNYTPNNRRHTLIITPIFTNEVMHGHFVGETDMGNFSHVYGTSLQLGTSMKFMDLMRQQIAIQNRLESSMDEIREKNDLLNHLSVTDALTGLFNRRGFYEEAEQLIRMSSYRGDPGVIGYVDMNNLKQVNDVFGHEEGDYALRAIGRALTKALPENAVLARIGGDEFAVCLTGLDEKQTEELKDRMKSMEAKLNRESKKPYFIECSIGLSPFVCSDSINVEEQMIRADKMLYENKKTKRKNVIKAENRE